MQTVARETRNVIINGIVQTVEVEIDPVVDEKVKRFQVADRIQRSLGFHVDSRWASTLGPGKNTGNMSKAHAAREYKGTCSNKEARRRRRAKDARRLARQD
jgi:hypothetical protein